MKVLIYATSKQGCQEGSSLEEAKIHLAKGDDVFYLHCGKCLMGCNDNPNFNKIICRICQWDLHRRTLKYIPKEYVHSVNDYFTSEIGKIAEQANFVYDTAEQLRELTYKEFDIGYGALSSYISNTRNMDPKMTNETKKYFNYLLKQQVILYEILCNVVEEFKPNLIIFHNGRFAQYKPFLGIAKKYGIDYICTETMLKVDGIAIKNYYYNTIPHDSNANFEKYKFFWGENDRDPNREKIAKSFFENRRYGKYAGDKIYVKDQEYGKLPKQWDNEVENIVIFNSSEDEFCAINRDVTSFALFKSQIEGITAILHHYKDDASKHFYLRIHPNLSKIKYSYHTDLYKLDFPNVTIIPATSPISSYSLLDKADKVIVFGSTMGIEAAFWKKTVILLGYSFYKDMDITYTPRNTENLWKYIDTDKLPSKYNDNILKFGYYYMSDRHEGYKYVDNGVMYYKLFGKKRMVLRCCKLLWSRRLYELLWAALRLSSYKLGIFSNFKKIPIEEAETK